MTEGKLLLQVLRLFLADRGLKLDTSATAILRIPVQDGEDLRVPVIFLGTEPE